VGDIGEKSGDRGDRGENGVRVGENRVSIGEKFSPRSPMPTFTYLSPGYRYKLSTTI
jgi:hypothetical protein